MNSTDNGGVGYGSFPAGPANDVTGSMGVFQINIDPAYWPLFEASSGYPAYPGLSPSPPYTLTSPVLYDFSTQIGRSAPVQRPAFPGSYAVGTGADMDTVTAYPPSEPFNPFFLALPGTDEVLTEIQSFTLGLPPATNYCGCVAGTVPCPPSPVPYNMVMAGQFNADYNALAASLGLPYPLPPSLGLVQSQANGETAGGYFYSPPDPTRDFPANSFFDVNVAVDLPQLGAGSGYSPAPLSSVQFPTEGMILYSDPTQPLIVENVPPNSSPYNEAVCSLPPVVVYLHGQNTFAPTLYFAEDNPIPGTSPQQYYWQKGDPFGSLTLAGHGTLIPCNDPDGLTDEQILVEAVLGTAGIATHPMPIGYVFPPSGQFPPHPGITYDSIQGVNLGGQVLDAVTFNVDGFTVYLNSLILDDWENPVTLPSAGNSVLYSNPDALATCAISLDGTNYSDAIGSGPVQILISNPNELEGNTTFYTMQVQEMSLNFSSEFGNFFLQQSPNHNSYGTNIVQSSLQGGPVIGSYFNENFQFSTDDETWSDANRALYLELGDAPCGRAGAQLHVVASGSGLSVSWVDSNYTLQGSTSLSPANWVNIPGPSPVTISFPAMQDYYRLVCH